MQKIESEDCEKHTLITGGRKGDGRKSAGNGTNTIENPVNYGRELFLLMFEGRHITNTGVENGVIITTAIEKSALGE